MDMEETRTETAKIEKRKAFVEATMERLRQHYTDKTPMPSNDGEPMDLSMLQRLYRHVMHEGYGE